MSEGAKDFYNYFSPFHINQSGYKVSVNAESGGGWSAETIVKWE